MLPQGNKDAVFVQLHHFALVFAAVFRTIQRSIAGMVAVFVQDNLPEPVPGFALVPGHSNVMGITVGEYILPRSVASCGVFRQSHCIRPQGNDSSVIQASQRVHGQSAEKAGRLRFAPRFPVILGKSLPRLVLGGAGKRPQRTVFHFQNRGFHSIVEPSDALVGGLASCLGEVTPFLDTCQVSPPSSEIWNLVPPPMLWNGTITLRPLFTKRGFA